jgi:hypothetical protein
VLVRDDREPALYTADDGDCLSGNSPINVTLFEATYYQDDMTVAFHLGGNTHLTEDEITMFLGAYAYSEPRFQLNFNPCNANIRRYVNIVRLRCTMLTQEVSVHSKPGFRSEPLVSYQSAHSAPLVYLKLRSPFRFEEEAT